MQSINTQHVPSPHGASGDTTPISPIPRSGSISLQAAATLNAGLQRSEPSRPTSQSPSALSPSSLSRHSPTAGRRRSQVIMGLQIADPSVPAPGEMVGDVQQIPGQLRNPAISGSPLMLPQHWEPHHTRTPSLGELHQELENEQEFRVNRLLLEIRRLQVQVQRQQSGPGQSSAVVSSDEASSDRSTPLPIHPTSSAPQPPPHSVVLPSGSVPRSPGFNMHARTSFDMARADLQRDLQRRSRTPSRGASPRLRSASISGDSGEHWVLGGRDESAFYQAETQMLTRENQMLRHRIRDLERQLSETAGTGTTPSHHEPSHASHLHRSTSISEEGATRPTHLTSSSLPTVTDTPKEE
ncbi:hypothetical protein CONLIGDRAFT_678827 [Coniochaeta ligniaria NRRL 30616]|uniref:Uncharacterized protein n=1 Tax=Coniochaeta ligniaria NRRL 30616 TaxID=1408157 RepID=A0A1J7JR53_9PEZI|nr:hypothetical protein CONLIGDRAFT_678827 [Coniochaeta ligniaria NRRL 30616]